MAAWYNIAKCNDCILKVCARPSQVPEGGRLSQRLPQNAPQPGRPVTLKEFAIVFGYLERVWACRYFWLSLVKIDLRARYRRSLLGVGWSLLRPIALTVILCVVFQRLFHRADVWSYAPNLLAGLACWDYITTATRQGCQCFFQGESYIRQHPAPVAIFPLRIALAETFHFLVGLTVIIGLSWYVHGFGNLPALVSLGPRWSCCLPWCGRRPCWRGLPTSIFRTLSISATSAFRSPSTRPRSFTNRTIWGPAGCTGW